jgi:hypothetical protein
MTSKGSSKMKPVIEAEGGDIKPLANTILQEFQNLKNKFKNDDEEQQKGTKSRSTITEIFVVIVFFLQYNFSIILPCISITMRI